MIRKKYETKRLIIRSIIQSDYEAWKEFYSGLGPSKSKFDLPIRIEAQCNFGTFKKIIGRHKKKASADSCYIYGAFHKETKELIGVIDVSVINRGWYQMGNLGYRVGNRYWKKGYGSEMVKKVLINIQPDLKLHRLEAAIIKDNKSSLALARAAGMTREGIKQGYIFEDNRWIDHVIYVFLANPTSLT